jgi:gamma-glutamyltranspeptidase/glutathione hydrolase/leukotriene-C4 hydrolase
MRMNLGDPEVPPPPGVVSNISGAIHDMLSPAFNAALRAMTLDDATLPLGEYGARWNLVEDHGTTHVSVVDSSRNAVAMTSTINTAFGSKVVSPSTGILLNNEMDDFSVPGEPNHYGLAPSAANFIAPGRAPLSSMSPTVVLDGSVDPPRVVAVAGASGGPRIITAVAQVLLNVLALNMSPLDAVDAPRVHHQLVPDKVFAENTSATVGDGAPRRVDDATAAALRKRGHVVEFSDTKTAVAQLIVVDRDTDAVHAVSDARKGGAPAAQDRDRDEEQRRRRR